MEQQEELYEVVIEEPEWLREAPFPYVDMEPVDELSDEFWAGLEQFQVESEEDNNG